MVLAEARRPANPIGKRYRARALLRAGRGSVSGRSLGWSRNRTAPARVSGQERIPRYSPVAWWRCCGGGGGYVYLDRSLRVMVTLTEVEPKILKKVFTFLEGVTRKVPLDEVPFTVTSHVAELIAATPAQRLPLADYILAKDEDGVVNPPAWAYEAVRWLVAKRLAAVPFVDQAIKRVTEPFFVRPVEQEVGREVAVDRVRKLVVACRWESGPGSCQEAR
jgi:hypothetical protein